jgi:DNA-binding CsgD family transcriptional regulator
MFRLYLNDAMDNITQVDLYGPDKGFPTNQNNTLYRIQNKIVFSSERGFYLYNKQTDQMEPYEALNSLFASPPNSIRLYENKKGDIWCVSGKFMGVIKRVSENDYKMDSLSYRILQPQIIIGFEHFNFIERNKLIVSTEDGFYRIDTKQEPEPESPFNIISLSVNCANDKSAAYLDENNSSEYENVLFVKKQNSLRFEFAAPEYREEDIVQYSYMLENYDKTWSDFNTDNLKEYTYLPKGNYAFKIKARNLFEAEEAAYTYSFTILPAWYETRLAFVVYGIFVLVLIAGLIIVINRRSQKKTMDMEKRKELELEKQKKQHEEEMVAKKHEIKELKSQQLQYNLRHKSQELANSTMNLIRKNEILLGIMKEISNVHHDIKSSLDTRLILSRLSKMERDIKHNIESDDNWKRFEENFDLAYENFLKRLGGMYPELTVSDKKLCAYLKMDLSTKDIAPLLNMSIRSIETNRYRLRKKLDLGRNDNLSLFLQRF